MIVKLDQFTVICNDVIMQYIIDSNYILYFI